MKLKRRRVVLTHPTGERQTPRAAVEEASPPPTPVAPPHSDPTEGPTGGESSGTATAVKTSPQRPRTDRLPPWRVLLHNDDHNSMLDVVVTIRMLTALSTPQATQCMLEAHTRGLSLLMLTHREHAELLQEQFASKKLVVTIEPAG